MKYKYLLRDQVRLLELRPSSTPDEPLVGRLLHVFLHNLTNFQALSYTWGSNGNSPGKIRISQQDEVEAESDCPLTDNLFAALKQLRGRERVCRLWIDQLCIDQSNDEEKALQVPLMGQIYSQAIRVIVWLGKEDEDTKLGFDRIPPTVKDIEDIRSSLRQSIGTEMTEDEEDRLIASNWPILYAGSGWWLAHSRIFQREYFRRVWIIQEVVLARDVLVMCGKNTTSWDELTAIAKLHRHTHFSDSSGDEKRAVDFVTTIATIRKNHHVYGSRLPPVVSVFAALFLEASNERDKIYGTLGLLDTRIARALPIDYRATIDNVFISAAAYFIQSTASLDILSCVVEPGSPTLPSWAPDCRVKPLVRQRILPSTNSLACQNSLIGPFGFQICSDRRQLCATGLSLGVITDVGSIASTPWELAPISWMDMAYRAAELKDPSIFPLNLQRALCASDDVAVLGSATYERETGAFDAYWFHANKQSGGKSKYAGKHSPHMNIASEFHTRMEINCMGRRLVVTQDQRLVLGPKNSRVGDVVCWLHGCSVPLVVRRLEGVSPPSKEDRWTLIGACYLQDHMSGPLTHVEGDIKHFILQ